MENKPLIVFANFWEADSFLHKGELEYEGDTIALNDANCTIWSIALKHPTLTKMKFLSRYSKLSCLDFLCPSWDILTAYKSNNDWITYTSGYREIMKKNRDKIMAWVDSLEPDQVYVLCCWENTKLKSHCHRQLIYDAFVQSEFMSSRLLTMYRD